MTLAPKRVYNLKKNKQVKYVYLFIKDLKGNNYMFGYLLV